MNTCKCGAKLAERDPRRSLLCLHCGAFVMCDAACPVVAELRRTIRELRHRISALEEQVDNPAGTAVRVAKWKDQL